jgi:hypothetical protein
MAISARFYISEITRFGNFNGGKVKLNPAYANGANKDWAQATPSGSIELNVNADKTTALDEFTRIMDAKQDVAITFEAIDRVTG